MTTAALLDTLRATPPGALIPRDWLIDQLEEECATTAEGLRDLTVEEMAELSGRAASTVRGWLAAKKISEAYRLMGREWRVPREAFRRFLDQQTTAGSEGKSGTQPSSKVDLSEWRRHLNSAA
jgi:excisionase family DNA binding protein